MREIAGLLIPADDNTPIRRLGLDPADLQVWRRAVGGDLNHIPVPDPPCLFTVRQGTVHEGANPDRLPFNHRATVLLSALYKPWATTGYLVGDAVITGHPDARGEPVDVPDTLTKLLLHARLFKAEVRLHGQQGWASNMMVFADWVSAATFVIDLGRRWTEVTATRIAVADP